MQRQDRARELQLQNRWVDEQVVVGIVDPWNDHAPGQIHAFCLRTGQRGDLLRSAGRHDAVAFYSKRLYVRARRFTRKNLAIEQN